MIIEPTPQEKARDKTAPARVIVTTTSLDRIHKPGTDDEAFGEAADLAVTEATQAGFDAIAYVNVAEFITLTGQAVQYRYLWEFTAHRPPPGA